MPCHAITYNIPSELAINFDMIIIYVVEGPADGFYSSIYPPYNSQEFYHSQPAGGPEQFLASPTDMPTLPASHQGNH